MIDFVFAKHFVNKVVNTSELLTDAKWYFIKNGCPAQDIGNKYVKTPSAKNLEKVYILASFEKKSYLCGEINLMQ